MNEYRPTKQEVAATMEFQAPSQADIAPTQSRDISRLMELAVSKGEDGVSALERLVAIRNEDRDYLAAQAFNAAMSQAQAEIGRISADATNPQTRSRYATYAKLDKALRPIYTRHGFALSFDMGEVVDDTLPIYCYVTHQTGHTRRYYAPMDCSGMGAKGNAVMTRTHARGSAASYGMRYLLKMIFNVAIGEEDDDGAGAGGEFDERISDEQAANIRALMEEVNADRDRFLAYASVDCVEDIRVSRYDKLVRALESKRSA